MSNTQDFNLETNLPIVISKLCAAFKAAEVLVNAVTLPDPSLIMAGAGATGLYLFCSACQAAIPSKEAKAKHPTFAGRFAHFLKKPVQIKQV